MADAKPYSEKQIERLRVDLASMDDDVPESNFMAITPFNVTDYRRFLATIERLRGALEEADELLQRHDAGQLHNDHYGGHVLQRDTVAFFARQALDGKEK